MANDKFEITEIAHEEYPFLHRIRALRDVGDEVKAGDVGGFVEHEANLSSEDESWIFDDAVSAGNSRVEQDSRLRDHAVACDCAYISQGSVMSGNSRADGYANLRGAVLQENALVSGSSAMVLNEQNHPDWRPVISGDCAIYGTVYGNIIMEDSNFVGPNEAIRNVSSDIFVINRQGRSVRRDPARNQLVPTNPSADFGELPASMPGEPPEVASQPGKLMGMFRKGPKRREMER